MNHNLSLWAKTRQRARPDQYHPVMTVEMVHSLVCADRGLPQFGVLLNEVANCEQVAADDPGDERDEK
jgi:hypothetical protein